MFRIENNVITITRGDTASFSVTIKQSDGTTYDYSNDTVLFTVKQNICTTEKLLQKTVVYGEDVVLLPSDTEGLPYGDFWFDVQLTGGAGTVQTVITPTKFRITGEVTF